MNNIVLVWAWWTGMSWLAMMLFDIGYKNIICINNTQTDLTDRLRNHWLKVIIGHGNYTVDIKDFVIYSDIQAIIDGPEITQSRIYQQTPTKKHFHICMTYNQFIAEISKRFNTISISGSNGKTSTTALLIWTLASLWETNQSTMDRHGHTSLAMTSQFGLGIVWWLMPNFDQQWYAISSDTQIQSDIHHLFEHIFNQKHQLDYSLLKKYIFVIEACEHREHFLLYDTDYTLITNIARDHTDYYHTRELYKDAFVHMIQKTRKQVVLTPSALATLDWYQLPEVIMSDNFSFETKYLIGSYSYSNASLVQKLLWELWYNDNNKLQEILSNFQWVGRRMEYIGQIDGKTIYSDYSHHAPAIAGNMEALQQQFPDKKICVIFQPHQAQRVLVWRDDFKESLAQADTTIIYKLYTAREDFTSLQQEFPRLQSLQNFDELWVQFAEELHAHYITQIDDIQTALQQLWDDYIIVVFSAGDLDEKMRKIMK